MFQETINALMRYSAVRERADISQEEAKAAQKALESTPLRRRTSFMKRFDKNRSGIDKDVSIN